MNFNPLSGFPPHLAISMHVLAGNSSLNPSSESVGGGGRIIGTLMGYVVTHDYLHFFTLSAEINP